MSQYASTEKKSSVPPTIPPGSFDEDEQRLFGEDSDYDEGSDDGEGEPTSFLPIDIDCLKLDEGAPCDLYTVSDSGSFALFAGKGLTFDSDRVLTLTDNGIEKVFVPQSEASLYFIYLKRVLEETVNSPRYSTARKAKVVHAACKDIMDRVFLDPRAPFLQHAVDIIHTTVDLLVQDGSATRHLVHLTEHDALTYIHSTNVGIFAIALARVFLGADADREMKRLGPGFFLHDLGKTRIPLNVLYKKGPLDPPEWDIVRRHPGDGHDLLEEEGFLTEESSIIVLQHHERDDGQGYPKSLPGRDIHPYARICRMADVFEALTSDRPYRKKLKTFDALKLMKEKILTDIDKDLFQHFVRLFC